MLAKILGYIGFICFLLGLGGMCGAIENGTGMFISLILLLVGTILLRVSAYEDGSLRRKKRTTHRPK